MRILSQNETALLIGDMSNITLPPNVELYISYGITQVFQRVTTNKEELTGYDWLHIPLETLISIKQNLNNVPQTALECLNEITPIQCEDKFLYPIYVKDDIDIILVSTHDKLSSIDTETITCLVETFDVYKEKNLIYGDNHNLFLQTVAENNESILDFTKSILNLFVKEIPRSCAAYYTQEKENLIRRVIVGDLSKFDLVPQIAGIQKKQVWDDSITKANHFISTDNLSEEVQFLAEPPDVYFIHNGLQSTYSKNYITLLIPGNSDLSTIHFLKTITKMTGELEEKQFLNSLLILDFYKKYMSQNTKGIDVQLLLEKLFILMNKQLRITRLLYFNSNITTEICFTKSGVYKVDKESNIKLTQEMKNRLCDEYYCMVENNSCYENNKDGMDVYVQTEWLYKLNVSGEHDSYIAIGSPKDIGSLDLYTSFIDDVVIAFSKCKQCLIYQEKLENLHSEEKLINSKLHLTSELSSGYFNQIFSKMTVIIGKADHIKKQLSEFEHDEAYQDLCKSISTIAHNADLVADYFTSLRSIISIDDWSKDRIIKSAMFMRDISNLLGGFLHHNYIHKNIYLRLDNVTQMKSGFLISGVELYGCIIPVIMSIVKYAQKDGTITLEAKRELEADFVRISFDKALIENHNISELVIEPFLKYNIQADEDGMFVFDDLLISHFESINETITVKIRLKKNITASINEPIGVLARV